MSGRTLQEAVLLMVPEAWQKHKHMAQAKRDFYEYNSCIMESWTARLRLRFTDGNTSAPCSTATGCVRAAIMKRTMTA